MSLERREVLVYELKNITERIVKLQIYLSSSNKDSKMKEILEEELQILKNYSEIICSKIILLMKNKQYGRKTYFRKY